MQSSAIAKTVLARKRELALLLVTVGVLCAVGFGLRHSGPRVMVVGKHQFKLETVDTVVTRSKGLSDRPSLAPDRGMLFVYEREENQCIWMKDMNFPIDIVWADSERRVVHLSAYISPDTYPENFCSSNPALYVIELPAGTIDRTGIRQGQVLKF